MPSTKPKILDFVAVCCVIALAAAVFCAGIGRQTGKVLQISYAGKTEEYSLQKDREITVENGDYALTVVISGGKAGVCASNCPDLICKHSGSIDKVGESIVCVPAGVKMTVIGEADYDWLAG